MEFKKITEILSASYFAVPDYQRDYAWTNVENSVLFDDLKEVLLNKEQENHFLGAIVTVQFEGNTSNGMAFGLNDYGIGENDVKHVVDGQQRLTSISLLLCAILNCMKEDVPERNEHFEHSIKNCLFGPSFNLEKLPPRLFLNGNTGRYYASRILEIRDDDCCGVYVGAKRLKKAYDFFVAAIRKLKDELISSGDFNDEASYYYELATALAQRLMMVEIKCGSSTNAFQVFESLNGKGLDLTAADRIKNLFLSWHPDSRQAVQKWDAIAGLIGEENLVRFFVCLLFFRLKTRVSQRRLPDKFKALYKDSALRNFEEFYKQIKEDAEIFSILKHRRTGIAKLDNRLLLDLEEIKNEQVLVMLSAVPLEYGRDILNTQDYFQYVEALTNLVVRMQVCQKSPNMLDGIFVELLNLLDKRTNLSVVTDRIVFKQNELISDSSFAESFAQLTFPKAKNAGYFLRKLEEAFRLDIGNRDEVSYSAGGAYRLTVEHIIPQTLDTLEDWYGCNEIESPIRDQFKETVVSSIGNLLLLYSDDNSAAGNKTYLEKVNVYRNGSLNDQTGEPEHTFALVKNLITTYPEKFTHIEVEERAKMLAEKAVDVWRS